MYVGYFPTDDVTVEGCVATVTKEMKDEDFVINYIVTQCFPQPNVILLGLNTTKQLHEAEMWKLTLNIDCNSNSDLLNPQPVTGS